jgi:hypothetical protein
MNQTVAAVLICFTLAAGPAFARGGHSGGHAGSHSVRGYVKKNGSYVAPHRATNPDKSRANNWSHKGNVNPYTGKKGTKKD